MSIETIGGVVSFIKGVVWKPVFAAASVTQMRIVFGPSTSEAAIARWLWSVRALVPINKSCGVAKLQRMRLSAANRPICVPRQIKPEGDEQRRLPVFYSLRPRARLVDSRQRFAQRRQILN